MISTDRRTPSRRSDETPTVACTDSASSSSHRAGLPSPAGSSRSRPSIAAACSSSPPRLTSRRPVTRPRSTASQRPSGHRVRSASSIHRPACTSTSGGGSSARNTAETAAAMPGCGLPSIQAGSSSRPASGSSSSSTAATGAASSTSRLVPVGVGCTTAPGSRTSAPERSETHSRGSRPSCSATRTTRCTSRTSASSGSSPKAPKRRASGVAASRRPDRGVAWPPASVSSHSARSFCSWARKVPLLASEVR